MPTGLIYFLSGILFYKYILPLFDNIFTWFASWVEYRVTKNSAKTFRLDQEMEQEKAITRQIGFVVENPEEYDDV